MKFTPQFFDELNKKLEIEIRAADSNCTWLPSQVERGNDLFVNFEFFDSRLPRFRSLILQAGGPLEWPDCAMPGHTWFAKEPTAHLVAASKNLAELEITLKKTVSNLGATWIDQREDLVGEPFAYEFHGRLETNSNLRNNLYVSLLAHFIPPTSVYSLLDLGGGFGCLLAKIAALSPKLQIYHCDFPRMGILAAYNLAQKVELEARPGRIQIVYPWEYPQLAAPVEVVVNTMSFQHMNEANLAYYFSRFRDLGVKQVFSINRETGMRRGEAASYMPILERYGYKLEKNLSLAPWREVHRLHLWSRAS